MTNLYQCYTRNWKTRIKVPVLQQYVTLLCVSLFLLFKIEIHVVENKRHELQITVQYSTRNKVVFEFCAIAAANTDCSFVIHSNECSRWNCMDQSGKLSHARQYFRNVVLRLAVNAFQYEQQGKCCFTSEISFTFLHRTYLLKNTFISIFDFFKISGWASVLKDKPLCLFLAVCKNRRTTVGRGKTRYRD